MDSSHGGGKHAKGLKREYRRQTINSKTGRQKQLRGEITTSHICLIDCTTYPKACLVLPCKRLVTEGNAFRAFFCFFFFLNGGARRRFLSWPHVVLAMRSVLLRVLDTYAGRNRKIIAYTLYSRIQNSTWRSNPFFKSSWTYTWYYYNFSSMTPYFFFFGDKLTQPASSLTSSRMEGKGRGGRHNDFPGRE